MKVIEGGFGKKDEDTEESLGSDVFQSYADMLSDMEEAEEFIQPIVMAVVAWPGVPVLIGSNIEDTKELCVLTDFIKLDLLNVIAYKEAEATGIFEDDDDGDDTIH